MSIETILIWMAIGLVIYFVYGRKHSVMTLNLSREIAEHGTGGAYTSGTHEVPPA